MPKKRKGGAGQQKRAQQNGGGAGKQKRAAGQHNGGGKATGGEWKEVEKLATEVALHPEAFVGGDEALSHQLAQATKHLFDLSTLDSHLFEDFVETIINSDYSTINNDFFQLLYTVIFLVIVAAVTFAFAFIFQSIAGDGIFIFIDHCDGGGDGGAQADVGKTGPWHSTAVRSWS
jgi:hypothetical protein